MLPLPCASPVAGKSVVAKRRWTAVVGRRHSGAPRDRATAAHRRPSRLRAIRCSWPRTEILLRADSHYYCPEVIDWCRETGVDFIFGVAPTSTLRRHVQTLEASIQARFEAAPKTGKLCRFKEFFDGAASWSPVGRIIARVEAGSDGTDTRFIVANLKTRNASRFMIYRRQFPNFGTLNDETLDDEI
jgi:hypothetical protein